MRFSTLTLFAFTALPAIACTESVHSTDVRTSGVYAVLSVTANGNGSSGVSAGLRVGGSSSNTYMQMKGEDELTAAVGTEVKTLGGGPEFYKTTFATDAEDTAFVIAFNRGPDDIDAPNSTVSLPAPFMIAGVAGEISRAAGFTATWAAATAGDAMRWSIDGDCMFETRKSLTGDTGTLTVVPTDFSMHSGEEQTTCNANFCVARNRKGQLDPAYGEGGVIDAEQQRCAAFISAP